MSVSAITTVRKVSSRQPKAWLTKPDAWMAEDLDWLARACDGNYGGIGPDFVLGRVSAGTLEMFRIEGAADGILISEISCYPAGKEAVIWALAGKNLVYSFPDILAQYTRLAQKAGCRWIGARSENPRIVHYLMQRCGLEPRAHWVQAEIGNVN